MPEINHCIEKPVTHSVSERGKYNLRQKPRFADVKIVDSRL